MKKSCRDVTRRQFASSALAASVAAVAVHAAHPAAGQGTRTGTAKPPEVFCDTMQTGTLCPTGTVGLFKLSGAKAEAWLTAVGRYNKAVMDATQQLRGDVKGLLTPEQLLELDRWFRQGLNTEVNRTLASQTRRLP